MKRTILKSFGIFLIIVLLQGLIFLFLYEQISASANERREASELNSDVYFIEMRHYKWLQNLTHSIYTGTEFNEALNSKECSMGEWLDSDVIKNTDDPVINKYVQDLIKPHAEIHSGGSEIVKELEKGNVDGAIVIYNEQVFPNMGKTIELLDGLNKHSSKIIEDKNEELDRINMINYIVIVVLILLSIGIGLIIVRRLTNQVVPPLKILTEASTELAKGNTDINVESQKMRDEFAVLSSAFNEMVKGIKLQAHAMNTISKGDYTVSISVRSEDDLMNISINRMLDENSKMLEQVQKVAEQVAEGAKQISSGSQMLATGSTEQAYKIEQLTVSIAEILKNAEDNSKMASKTMDDMIKAEELMNDSMEHMKELNNAMDTIDKSSNSIAKVIEFIEDIAFQTNLLSLNAAVEAARAGSYGKGFAVVADEVKELAGKSSKAANESSDLIENSISNTKIGIGITDVTNSSLNQVETIVDSNTEAMNITNEISKKQAELIANIAEGIEQISTVVKSTSATSEESATSAEELNAQSQLLKDIVSRFKLKHNN